MVVNNIPSNSCDSKKLHIFYSIAYLHATIVYNNIILLISSHVIHQKLKMIIFGHFLLMFVLQLQNISKSTVIRPRLLSHTNSRVLNLLVSVRSPKMPFKINQLYSHHTAYSQYIGFGIKQVGDIIV